MAEWRSVRAHSETNTERSCRTLALPAAAVQALHAWTDSQAEERLAAGDDWHDTGLFTTDHGAALDAGNIRNVQTSLHRGRHRRPTQCDHPSATLSSTRRMIARLPGCAGSGRLGSPD